jgi:radical SAM protein with 4Fe4S-binding SPASM domain
MAGVRKANCHHPPLDQLTRIVDALAAATVREVTFLGGDPAIYPSAVPLARHANERGIAVSILSNTHRYPGSSVEEAANWVSAFETTIHAPKPEEHDAFCQKKGAFEYVVSRLRRAAAAGRKTGLAINVTPQSAGQVFDIADTVRNRYGVPLDYIIVQRIIPFGRAQTTSAFTIAREHAERALVDIERIDNELGIRISVEDPFPLCVLPVRLRKYMTRCAWGFTKASVNDKGDLSRCGADPRCRLGNILQTPLLEIWNNSPTLLSFRDRKYLPGRCQTCADLDRCGGGCPLSCEIEKDHGLDYLFLEYQRLDAEIHGELTFDVAREEELSSILQIEWSDFPGYSHIFSVSSIRDWYKHNPSMFRVLRDARNWVMAYACVVPVTARLREGILAGKFSSLTQFPKDAVLRDGQSPHCHVEVVASAPTRSSSRVGRTLIREVGGVVLAEAQNVTAAPVTDIGTRLCKYFGFRHVADELFTDAAGTARTFPIFDLRIDREAFQEKLERF